MDIKNSKSIFARLLAQEDLKVHHSKVPTASFDTKSRTLTLPIWTDMDGDLYDLLCGHEVGHALYTPNEGWHDAICGKGGDHKTADMVMKGFLNVLEDARIEKKIKTKYPGLRTNFYKAYQGLHERDFFQVAGKDPNEMLLIDRINLHFKLGSFVAVKFNNEAERNFVQRTERLETWAEVEALARELMAYCKDELESKQDAIKKKLVIKVGPGEMSDTEDGEPINLDDYDEVEYDFGEEEDGLTDDEREMMDKRSPICETDRAFRRMEEQLLDQKSRAYEYATLPTIDASPFIVSHKSVLAQMKFAPEQETYRAETLSRHKAKNDKVVGYLVKEFELRRNAEQQARAKTAKSGEIDVKKIFSYRYNEDLFKRITTVPNGKNHGLIVFFDMSGSMSTQMGAALEQMIVLVEFCRKVNIPFEVYGFSNSSEMDLGGTYASRLHQRQPVLDGEIHIDDNHFTLRQYFTDQMRPTEYKRMVSNLVLLARIWARRGQRYRYSVTDQELDSIPFSIPDSENLNGTPLNQSIMLSVDIYNKFVARTKAQIVNMAVLTDGDTDNQIRAGSVYTGHGAPRTYAVSVSDPDRVNVILTHKESRKSVRVQGHDKRCTLGLVALVREVTGANIVCFDIVESKTKRVIQYKMYRGKTNITPAQYADLDVALKKFRRDRVYVIEDNGFNEYYLIPGGSDLDIEDDDFAVTAGADKKTIFKAFAEMQNNKTTSRVLLNRFIKMIA